MSEAWIRVTVTIALLIRLMTAAKPREVSPEMRKQPEGVMKTAGRGHVLTIDTRSKFASGLFCQ
jgi:hypothetical protein